MFWSDIRSQEHEHNDNAEWLEEVKDEFQNKVRAMEDIEITLEDVVKRIRGMSSWKAPGPDGVQGYWFKTIDCLHKPIVQALQQSLREEIVPYTIFSHTPVLMISVKK